MAEIICHLKDKIRSEKYNVCKTYFNSNTQEGKCIIEPLTHFIFPVFLQLECVFLLTSVIWLLDRPTVHYTNSDWKDGKSLFVGALPPIYFRQGQKTPLIQLCAWLMIKSDCMLCHKKTSHLNSNSKHSVAFLLVISYKQGLSKNIYHCHILCFLGVLLVSCKYWVRNSAKPNLIVYIYDQP